MFNLIKAYPRHSVNFDQRVFYLTMSSFLKCDYFDKTKIVEFERAFAAYVGTKEAISVPSGRIGLHLILKAFQYPPGSEIILSDYNFHPIVSVIIGSGLRPVFVDIDPLTFNIDAEKIEEKISSNTRAILVTHIFGNPCEMDAISRIAKRNGLDVIEDGAHAFGSEWRGQRVGNLGDAAFFSLSYGKNIASFGGGVITTSNRKSSERIRNNLQSFPKPSPAILIKKILKTGAIYKATKRPLFNLFLYPLLKQFNYLIFNIIDQKSREKVCLNCKSVYPRNLSSLQANIGLYQLSRVEEYKKKKRTIIEYLDQRLKELKSITVQHTLVGAENYKLYYVIGLKNRSKDGILGTRYRLLERGVDTQFLDMDACSLFKEFKSYACDCSNAASVASSVFEIPSDTSLNLKDLVWIAQSIEQCVK